jgi:hypothetical protein
MARVATLGQLHRSTRLGLGLLRVLHPATLAPCTDGARAADHSLRSWHFKRHAAALRGLHRLRSQGCDVEASGLEAR